MDCPDVMRVADEECMRDIWMRMMAGRVPILGHLNLTDCCNLKCVHCYIEPKRPSKKTLAHELSTAEWKIIISDAVEDGCLFLTFSGGEPLLRSDFEEIYLHAVKSGVFVTIFTNATLLTEQHLKLFRQYPPMGIEISVYGSDAESYQRVTGDAGAWDRLLWALNALKKEGLPFLLKSILMQPLKDQLPAIRELALHFDVEMRIDPIIIPSYDGNVDVDRLRMTPEEVVNFEMSIPEVQRTWRSGAEHMAKRAAQPLEHPEHSERLYTCGSGKNAFFVGATGAMQPCIMVVKNPYIIREGSFHEGWVQLCDDIHSYKTSGKGCSTCQDMYFCGYCPPRNELSGGAEEPCEFYCEVARKRREYISSK